MDAFLNILEFSDVCLVGFVINLTYFININIIIIINVKEYNPHFISKYIIIRK